MRILMVAAENDAIPRAKVGGIGDVVRDVPPVLAERGHEVSVVVPSYGYLHEVPGATRITALTYRFGATDDRAAALFEVPGKTLHEGVTHYVIDHPAFASRDAQGRLEIYHRDPDGRPFATDATKYARFCMAVAELVRGQELGRIDCLHLHDWHAGLLAILRAYHPVYAALKSIPTVYTIHNLALQGIRPLRLDDSSLETWYPGLVYDSIKIVDPRWRDCVNPAVAGINLSDKVHTVSPSYAKEILKPSDRPRYYGGEGLQDYLRAADAKGRLIGILNGCEYPQGRTSPRRDWKDLVALLRSSVLGWASSERTLSPAQFVAYTRLSDLPARAPAMVLTFISRIVEQKVFLLRAAGSKAPSGLAGVLEALGPHGVLLILGTGDPDYERFLLETSGRYPNLIFLNGYSNACAEALYASGDLFVMPSSFEPCGISQMLAMRDGQPCLVHDVGGLRDTVEDGVSGFAFDGESVEEQVDRFIAAAERAIRMKLKDQEGWKTICKNAAAARFRWSDSVDKYLRRLYS
jgi:starch synthase